MKFMVVLATAAGCWVSMRLANAAESPDFEGAVAPLIMRKCLECHNPPLLSGGLDLTRRDKAVAGGESGIAIVPGDPENSHLVQRVRSGEMPPKKNGKSQSLSAEEVRIFGDWVKAGAPWSADRLLDPFEKSTEKRGGRDWWSLQPVSRRAVPPAISSGNPIDAYIGAKLATRHLALAPAVDRRTLLRRVSYDLTGLPPAADQMAAFIADTSADAYEKQVDRLLNSPEFGERWARHWLDVVRYSETNGYERDAIKTGAWRYRDWVIKAFNDDLPYNQFVTEQLAGDELPERNEVTVSATGFIRLGTWDDEPNDAAEYQYERLEDLVHSSTTAFLGLTVKCARCHDHKFDPILQSDYYRVAAAFWAGPVAHRQRELNGGPTKDELGFDVLGWTDLSRDPPPLHLLVKGDMHRPGPVIAAGSLSAIPSLAREFAPPPAESKTSKRRLQLAEWICDPQNPLTARVIVNRLWQHHFGEGLVRTPDNFGFLGQRPTHPELLDWLASELVAGGWKLKRLHRLIVLSDTYRQSAAHPQQAEIETFDAGNQLWWRANRRRLDAESLRDSLLFTAGTLDFRRGGPSFFAPISSEALEGLSQKSGGYTASPVQESNRRSIYMVSKRALAVPLMSTFDACDTTQPTGRRDVTTVAPQALALMNNLWVHEQCNHFAERVLATSAEPNERIDAAWQIALGRLPTADERRAARNHVMSVQQQHAGDAGVLSSWSSLCHVLMNTNEFLYVD